MSWTRIQGIANDSTATNQVTLGSPVTSGNFVIGYCNLSPGFGLTSITDDKGNSYNIGLCSGDNRSADGSDIQLTIFYSPNPITNTPSVFTFHNTNGTPANFFTKIVEEFNAPSGTTAISQDGGFQQMMVRGATSLSPMQVFNNNTLVYSVCFTTGSLSAGAGFTSGTSVNNGSVFEETEYAVVSGPTTSTVTWVPGGSLWAIAAGIAPVPANTWQMAQNNYLYPGNEGNTTTQTLPLLNSVGIGNVWVLNCISGGGGTFISLVDNLSNNYTPLLTNTGRLLFWSGGMNTTPGITSFTLTVSVAANLGIYFTEWTPPLNTVSVFLDPSGGAPTNPITISTNGSGGNNFTPTITTTKPGDLVYSIFEPEGVQGTNTVDGTAFLGSPDFSYSTGYKIQSSAGAVNTEWNSSTTGGMIMWTMGIAANVVAPTTSAGWTKKLEAYVKPNESAQALGRLGGLVGGPARHASLSASRRSEIAMMGAKARWR